jgi:glycosyltransferase involved in cell wall biosynthesis
MQPLVSIGMPIFNCSKTLETAILSIFNQTYSNWELIIIDDGSKDKTLEIAKGFQNKDSRILVFSDGYNKQLPYRLNQAIALSKGKYFARMDGDDISYPERLKTQVEYLTNHPEIDLLATQIITIDRDGNPRGKYSPIESHADICVRPWTGFPMTHPTWMGKIEWFRKYQYRTKAIRMEDQDILLRAFRNSRFACLPDILLGYRVESFSLKKSLTGRYNFSLALLEQAFLDKDYFFVWGVVEQSAKALVDIFAMTTALNLKLLKHRVGKPVDTTELNRWKEVLSKCVNEHPELNRMIEH